MTRTLLVAAALAAGCSKKARYVDPDDVSKVEGTGIEARDAREASGQMARDLVSAPVIAQREGAPRIAVLPVENRSRFLIDAEILTTLITDELINGSGGKLAIVNRDLVEQIQRERQMKARGQVSDDGELPALAGVDFFLEGSIETISASTNTAQTDYVVIRFQLTDAETGIVGWSNRYEMKKEGRWGVMYQ